MNTIYYGDNLSALADIATGSIDLVYIDPPFNTGNIQHRDDISYSDKFDNFMEFLEPRLREIYRILSPRGSLYFHIDYREVANCRILLDKIFGRDSFLNEIIWAYDYGGRSKSRWSAKHDNILWYVKDVNNYIFNYDAMERIPYMAPDLVGPEKAAIGKTVTDTWWHTIVPTNGKEKTGYPTQKPLGILRRIVAVSSLPDSIVLDCFAGSGTLGAAALEYDRRFYLMDSNRAAIEVMANRFIDYNITYLNCDFLWNTKESI